MAKQQFLNLKKGDIIKIINKYDKNKINYYLLLKDISEIEIKKGFYDFYAFRMYTYSIKNKYKIGRFYSVSLRRTKLLKPNK